MADAIIAANYDWPEGGCPAGRGADTITLTRDITLDGGLPKITSDITIEGEGYTISGDHRWRIFYNDGGALTINDLTMTKGYVEGELIFSEDLTLKCDRGSAFGGAIVNLGELIIINSNFSGNSALWGGAIANWGGELSISHSTFSNNLAEEVGGAIANDGELSMVNSIIAGRGGDVCYSDSRLRHNINNFIQDGSCSPAFEDDPMLGELDDRLGSNLALGHRPAMMDKAQPTTISKPS